MRALVVACGTLVGTLACDSGSREHAVTSVAPSALASAVAPAARSSAASKQVAPANLPALAGVAVVRLPVEGFGETVVAAPVGATSPRPILVALHGEGGDADAECVARRSISAQPFVLCPRGSDEKDAKKQAPHQGFADAAAAEKELKAALTALKKRFGAHVAGEPVMIAGTALGAVQAVALLRQAPRFFSRVVLARGGANAWSGGVSVWFAQGGGKRVLFACADAACRDDAQRHVSSIRSGGADARVAWAEAGTRDVTLRLADAIRKEWTWLTEDDARWAAPP